VRAAPGRPAPTAADPTERTLLYAIKEAAARWDVDDTPATRATLKATLRVFLGWEARQGGDRRFGPRP
jgi:hypothetical protein